MKTANPQNFAYRALQIGKEAKKNADAAQATPDEKVKQYTGFYCGSLTLEQLYQLGQVNEVAIGALDWNQETSPDANNVILIIGNWMTLAISVTGKKFRLDRDPYRWVEI